MEMEFDDMDDLIAKVLAGEATPEEKIRVEEWSKQQEANLTYLNHLTTIFEKAASLQVREEFDTDVAWNIVQNKINLSKEIINPEKQILVTRAGFVWRIAAGVAILIGLGYATYQLTKPTIEVFATASRTGITQDSLPDGSTAVLNKNSELSYEYNSREEIRRVKLNGEAYFSVRHEEQKPFVIETDEVLIRDIGTEFNVSAYPEKDTIEIIVTQGEVQFYTLTDPGLVLKAGERGIYSKRVKQFYRMGPIDANALSYKTKIFHFNNTEMTVVVKLLNKVYDSKIRLAREAISTCRLTANFSEDNLDTIVEVIAETMGFTIVRKENEILLDGKGCNHE